MHLDEYVRQVAQQLATAAALADDRTREIAGRLADAAGPAVRLALMSALGAAADEITAALLDSPGSPTVSVQMDGGADASDVRIDVTAAAPEPASGRPDDGDASARISLRLSEALKADVEQAAAREGVSVNTWLVRAAGAALAGSWRGEHPAHHGGHPGGRNPRHVTGWING